jgi:DNA-binding XRE family transcriptional regulator
MSAMKNRLKEILDARGIKYGWLAEQVGVNRNTIKNLMDGACPRLDLAYKIAAALGLSAYDIWPHS